VSGKSIFKFDAYESGEKMEEAWRKKIHPKANETYFTVYYVQICRKMWAKTTCSPTLTHKKYQNREGHTVL